MTYFPSVKDDGHLLHVFARFGRALDPLLALHDDILRGPSDLTIAQRELIAAYVSAVNDCQFCYNAHRTYSAAFGIDSDLFDQIIEDLDTAPLEFKVKSLLKFAAKLTRTPDKMVQSDVDDVLSAGWSEEALHDTVLVTNLFNFMNRIIFAHGLDGHDALYSERLAEVMKKPKGERLTANESEIGSKTYAMFGDAVRKQAAENE